MWPTFFNQSFEVSNVSDKFKRVLNVTGTIMLVFTYLYASKLCTQTFNKLLRAFATSKWVPLILIIDEWLMLLESM